jgi:hypothetical protein
MPVDDGIRGMQSLAWADVSDLRTLNHVRTVDVQASEQIGINLVLFTRFLGVGFRVDGVDSHKPYEVLNSLSIDLLCELECHCHGNLS